MDMMNPEYLITADKEAIGHVVPEETTTDQRRGTLWASATVIAVD